MQSTVRYVGLDVHKETIVMAVAESNTSPAEVLTEVAYNVGIVLKQLRKLGPLSSLQVCYEAGPTGFSLQRHLAAAGVACLVIAPSLIPSQSGNRIKTDRRDARKLAHFLRSGDLTAVYVPSEETEGIRDLERARDDAKDAERAARHQLGKFLLRQGRRYDGGHAWTGRHWRWIEDQKFADVAQQRVLLDYVRTAQQATERIRLLDREIGTVVQTWSLSAVVRDLQAFYGISLVTAVGLVAEVGDYHRFPGADRFMSFVGLVPSESSSGGQRRQGGITKTGNRHVRRLLVEAGWQYYRCPRLAPSAALLRRREGVPQAVIDIADKARHRLMLRARVFKISGKSPKKSVIALARELAGFVWAAARRSMAASAAETGSEPKGHAQLSVMERGTQAGHSPPVRGTCRVVLQPEVREPHDTSPSPVGRRKRSGRAAARSSPKPKPNERC
jgi:transposase